MGCPACSESDVSDSGSDNCGLMFDIRDVPYTYEGQTACIQGVIGEWCQSCGECFLDAAESSRVSMVMLGFNQRVRRASVVDENFVLRVRKKLALSQGEAARIFGGGINAFSRYESGRTRPPVALIKLLILLDRHPQLLSEICGVFGLPDRAG